jgi:hypothetical protein
LLKEKRNEMTTLVQHYFSSCDVYEENQQRALDLEEQIKQGLCDYESDRVRRMPARAPRRVAGP